MIKTMAIAKEETIRAYTQHYIDGGWTDAESSYTLEVFNSTTEDVIARVPQGTVAEANRAAAAKAAFDGWSQTPLSERTGWLRKIHAKVLGRQEELTTVISQEVGMPTKLCGIVQTGGPIREIAGFSDIADNYAFEEEIGNSIVVKEPIGVVACITPWNFPLNQIVAKFAPAWPWGARLC